MTDRPILFSGPMVRALLDGRKTQTRRVVKPQPKVPFDAGVWYRPFKGSRQFQFAGRDHLIHAYCNDVVYIPDDRLWVRETWRPHYLGDGIWDLDVSYAADGEKRRIMDGEFGEKDWTWPKAADRGNVSPLFMPRWASRLTLTVTDVRVQRLQDISEGDAIAEGCRPFFDHDNPTEQAGPNGKVHQMAPLRGPLDDFRRLWDSLNAHRAPWNSNPWICAVSFTVNKSNIDQPGAIT